MLLSQEILAINVEQLSETSEGMTGFIAFIKKCPPFWRF
jgi:hypothetical protein